MFSKLKSRFKSNPSYYYSMSIAATWAGAGSFIVGTQIAKDFGIFPCDWEKEKECDENFTLSEMDKRDVKPMPKIKLVMTSNKNDPKKLYDMLGTDKDRKDYALQFKEEKSNFIDRNLYNLNGQVIDKNYRGITIKNGRKYIRH